MNSRAYRNAASNGEDAFSVLSSAGRTASWSALSGLSLSEMSNIAILAIPIYAQDIANAQDYDFAPPKSDILQITSPPSQQNPDTNSLPVSSTAGPSTTTSPKKDLKSWWRQFRREQATTRLNASPLEDPAPGLHIFGVHVAELILYANTAISLRNEDGESFIYGYIPVVVAKCCVFLKHGGSHVADVFAKQGLALRVRQLQTAFDSPPRYGKGLDFSGYTVFDAASVLLRYLKTLPEPVIPYDWYDRFCAPLVATPGASSESGYSPVNVILEYQDLIGQMPPLSRQLLCYLLDMVAHFVFFSEFIE